MAARPKNSSLSPLNHLILGLLERQPSTGYRLCKDIESMPFAKLSGSPGAIYPALQVLEAKKLIRSKQIGGTIKPRKTFFCTAKGKKLFQEWLGKPTTAKQALGELEDVLLKLSFSGPHRDRLIKKLAQLHEDLDKEQFELKAYFDKAKKSMPLGPQLAVELVVDLSGWISDWAKKKEQHLRDLE